MRIGSQGAVRPSAGDLRRWPGRTPRATALGLLLAFAGGGGDGLPAVSLGLLGSVCWVAAPTAAVVLALHAQAAGHLHGTAAAWAGGSVLVVSVLAMNLLAFGGLGSLLAVLVVLAVLVLFGRPRGSGSSPT